MTKEKFKLFLDLNMPFAVKATNKFSKYPFVNPFRSRAAEQQVKEALLNAYCGDQIYTEKDLQCAFIAGGKASRNITGPSFEEVLKHLKKKDESNISNG